MGTTHGMVTEQFEPVREAFAAQLESGADLGASVAVRYRGELVVDLWGGHRDPERTSPWERDTLVNVWSTTKTMTFLAALLLAERGELEFDSPVARYWPEFAAAGKDRVLVRHLLGHTAGLSGWEAPLVQEDLADWEKCTAALAAQAPWWEPGTQSGYHAVTQGFLIGEVVRRLTGVSFGEFFRREFAEPLGADFYIGLPESEEHRVSLVVPGAGVAAVPGDASEIARKTLTSPPLDPTMPQHRWWRAAEIPAANGHGNARSVALLQSLVAQRGEVDGIRLLKSESFDPIFTTQADGIDLVLGVPLRFGMGYGLSNELMPIGPRACFWGGYGGSVIVMDQDAELTVAYMMNKMEVGLIGDLRGVNLVMAAVAAIA